MANRELHHHPGHDPRPPTADTTCEGRDPSVEYDVPEEAYHRSQRKKFVFVLRRATQREPDDLTRLEILLEPAVDLEQFAEKLAAG